MKALGLFFSGTGNTIWVANEVKEQLAKNNIKLDLKAIENNDNSPEKIIDILDEYDVFGIFYPIYSSLMPKIFRDYMEELTSKFNDKNIYEINAFSITTFAMFSGDGALEPKKYLNKMGMDLKWAYNVKMPSNINARIPGLRIPTEDKLEDYLLKYQKKAKLKIKKIVADIESNKKHLSGTNIFSTIGGRIQRSSEKSLDSFDIKINHDLCVKCGICVNICPTNNLEFKDTNGEIKLTTNSNCMVCLRCIHNCPKYALRLINAKGTSKFNQYNIFDEKIYNK